MRILLKFNEICINGAEFTAFLGENVLTADEN